MAPAQSSAPLSEAQDNQMIHDVFTRLLAVPGAARPVQYASWPPDVQMIPARTPDGHAVAEGAELNAGSAAPDCRPVVMITQALMDQIIAGDQNRLALVLGHELSHILLGHTVCKPEGSAPIALALAASRDQEYAADANGYKLALAAGFSARQALTALQRIGDVSGYSSFEALTLDHPTWTDRLARLDQQSASLWRSMSAFGDGAYFLATDNYPLAVTSFKAVLNEFPQTAEAAANLGYALLMQYASGLDTETVRIWNIGQPAVGAFYSQAVSIGARGSDVELWNQAVEQLKSALKQQPDLALANANLGVAYLLAPGGPQPPQALAYLKTVLTQAGNDRALQSGDAAMIARGYSINVAVATAAGGDPASAIKMLQELKSKPPSKDAVGFLQETALYYNLGMLLAASADPSASAQGTQLLQTYLANAPQSSPWWPIAYERYSHTCRTACKTEQQLAGSTGTAFREVAAVQTADGKTVRLGQSIDSAVSALQPGVVVSALPSSAVKRVRFSQRDMELIGNDVVIGIILEGARAPAIQFQEIGGSSTGVPLRVGMTVADFQRAIGSEKFASVPLFDNQTYRYYPSAGLAISVETNSTVSQMILVSLPSR